MSQRGYKHTFLTYYVGEFLPLWGPLDNRFRQLSENKKTEQLPRSQFLLLHQFYTTCYRRLCKILAGRHDAYHDK